VPPLQAPLQLVAVVAESWLRLPWLFLILLYIQLRLTPSWLVRNSSNLQDLENKPTIFFFYLSLSLSDQLFILSAIFDNVVVVNLTTIEVRVKKKKKKKKKKRGNAEVVCFCSISMQVKLLLLFFVNFLKI
jgi:hypothetical protein